MPRHRNKSYYTGMVITVPRYTVAQREECVMFSELLEGVDSLRCISYFLGGQEGNGTSSREKGMCNSRDLEHLVYLGRVSRMWFLEQEIQGKWGVSGMELERYGGPGSERINGSRLESF